jgi:hypothetical protein
MLGDLDGFGQGKSPDDPEIPVRERAGAGFYVVVKAVRLPESNRSL